MLQGRRHVLSSCLHSVLETRPGDLFTGTEGRNSRVLGKLAGELPRLSPRVHSVDRQGRGRGISPQGGVSNCVSVCGGLPLMCGCVGSSTDQILEGLGCH